MANEWKTLGSYIRRDGQLNEEEIRKIGEWKGTVSAFDQYPTSVVYDQQSIQTLAEHSYQTWVRGREATEQEKKDWEMSAAEAKRIYTSAFMATYREKVAQQDYIAGKKTGATVTVINQKHEGEVHTYWVSFADPLHFDEVQDFPLPLVVDFSEAPVSEGTTAATTSSYGASSSGMPARAYASSDPVSSSQQKRQLWDGKLAPIPSGQSHAQSQSKTPQKKKPRLYFGK